MPANNAQPEWTLEDIKGAAGAVFIAGSDTVSKLHAPIIQPPTLHSCNNEPYY